MLIVWVGLADYSSVVGKASKRWLIHIDGYLHPATTSKDKEIHKKAFLKYPDYIYEGIDMKSGNQVSYGDSQNYIWFEKILESPLSTSFQKSSFCVCQSKTCDASQLTISTCLVGLAIIHEQLKLPPNVLSNYDPPYLRKSPFSDPSTRGKSILGMIYDLGSLAQGNATGTQYSRGTWLTLFFILSTALTVRGI